jgi:phosphoribosylglycinamide formyltransferase 1
MLKKVAILSSGSGSNAQALITHFASQENIEVVFVGSNRASAGVLEKARHLGVHHGHFTKEDLHNGTVLNILKKLEVDWVLLAGFLLMIPVEFCRRYQGRILNIHPSLLPKYGGKGMYGIRIHEAVFQAGEKESGMTIHYVNERYDDGAVVFQGRVKIEDVTNAQEIADRVLKLEHTYYPRISSELITLDK